MKASPCKIHDYEFVVCDLSEATHLMLESYGHFPHIRLPVKGMTKSGPSWEWNGDTEKPTLRPSILTTCDLPSGKQVCHCFITDGKVEFLNDCTHEFAGQTLPLKDLLG